MPGLPRVPITRGIVPDYDAGGVIAPAAPIPQQSSYHSGFGPKFGRAWTITITPGDGSEPLVITNQNVPNSLEIRFSADMVMNATYGWVGEVDIWNLAPPTAKSIQQGAPYSNLGGVFHAPEQKKDMTMSTPLVLGDLVTISAGYHNFSDQTSAFNAHANIIYEGRILSAYWTRVDVKDYVLRLHLMTHLLENITNTSLSLGANIDDYTTLTKILKESTTITNLDLDVGSQLILTNNKYPTSQVLSGKPLTLINDILKTNMLWGWRDGNTYYVRAYGRDDKTITAQFTYASLPQGPSTGGEGFTNNNQANDIDYTLIDTPEQTQEGVRFNILMDSRPRIGGAVSFASGTMIAPAGIQPNQQSAVINTAGVYLVAGIHHSGNTMGTGAEWITSITAVTPNFFSSFLRGMNSTVKE